MTILAQDRPAGHSTRRNLKIAAADGRSILYRVEALEIDPVIGVAAFRLVNRASGATYDCHQSDDGHAACTCPDYEFRHAERGTACKHLAALVDAGMLAPLPSPPAVEPTVPCPCCNATGHIPNHGRCLCCGGSGSATASDLAEAGIGQPHPAPCPACGGEGRCPDCDPIHPAPTPEPDFADELCDAAFGDESDPADWPAWTDEPALSLLPPDEDVRLTLAEALEATAWRFFRTDSDLADLLGHTIRDLASEARICDARDVATLLDRRAALLS